MQDIVLKKDKEKSLLRRHPWVYDTAVAKAGQKGVKIAAGEMVRVVSHDGRELGFGGWSPASTLRVRMFTYAGEEAPQPGFLTRRIEKAVAARASLLERTNARRLVFAEADGIPGLVADMYGDWVVTQFQSAAVQANSEEIVAALMKCTGARGVFDRSDAATRKREGLEEHVGVLAGEEPPAIIEVVEDGVKYGSKDSYRTVKNVVIPPAVTTILDMKTQKTDGTLTRDQLGKFMGNGLLLVGADGTSPGQIDFYGENNPELSVETVTIFGYNSDTEVVFIVPRDLAEGKYRVTLTTYYSGTDIPLEEPRVIEIPEVTLV